MGEARKESGLLTTEDVCERYGVTRRSVYRWVEAGKLKAERAGKRLYFTPADVEQFAEQVDPFKVALNLEAQTYLDMRECLALLKRLVTEIPACKDEATRTAQEIAALQDTLEAQAPEAGAVIKAIQAGNK